MQTDILWCREAYLLFVMLHCCVQGKVVRRSSAPICEITRAQLWVHTISVNRKADMSRHSIMSSQVSTFASFFYICYLFADMYLWACSVLSRWILGDTDAALYFPCIMLLFVCISNYADSACRYLYSVAGVVVNCGRPHLLCIMKCALLSQHTKNLSRNVRHQSHLWQVSGKSALCCQKHRCHAKGSDWMLESSCNWC